MQQVTPFGYMSYLLLHSTLEVEIQLLVIKIHSHHLTEMEWTQGHTIILAHFKLRATFTALF